MTQEEKQLLLQDFCAKLPYNIIVECNDNDGSLPNIWEVVYVNIYTEDIYLLNTKTNATKLTCIEDIKPYLFPLSSMTEEQKEEFRNKFDINIDISKIFDGIDFCGSISFRTISEIINWCYKNHLDIHDLIPKRLAIDCTNLNIY